jgi:putative transposase
MALMLFSLMSVWGTMDSPRKSLEKRKMTLGQFADLQNFAPYYESGKMSTEFIATNLGLSRRHVRRLLKEHAKGQLEPTKRVAHNRLADNIREFIVTEKKANPRYNSLWLSEIVSDRFAVSITQPTVYRVLREADLLGNKQVIEYKARSRFETKDCGDLVQMDTTWGYWWKGERLCLTVLLDDHSRYILSARFSLSDTSWHNMKLIRDTVAKYGSFKLLYTDNASFFKAIRHNQSVYQEHAQNEYESEITRSCREAGITHICHKPYQPQGKGKVERFFRFFQERFLEDYMNDTDLPFYVLEKRLEEWIDWYNTKHVNRSTGSVPKERFNPSGFTPPNSSLDDIFSFRDTRKVDKCNSFSYQGQVYIIPKEKCMVAMRVELHIIPDRSIRVFHDNEFVCELELKRSLKIKN